MAEIRLRVKMEELGVKLEEINREIADQLAVSVAQLARLTYNRATELATTRLNSTKQQYLDALNFEAEGEGVFVIYLESEAAHLENGYPPFPMLPKLVRGPNSKLSKEGYRYAIIPIRQRVDSASTQPSMNARSLAMRIKEVVDERKFKQVSSSTYQGKVQTVEKYTGKAPHPFLKGLTRVREYASAAAKGAPLSSTYLTFRVASEKYPSKFKHPGFQGANVFPDIERWADDQLGNIIRDIFER